MAQTQSRFDIRTVTLFWPLEYVLFKISDHSASSLFHFRVVMRNTTDTYGIYLHLRVLRMKAHFRRYIQSMFSFRSVPRPKAHDMLHHRNYACLEFLTSIMYTLPALTVKDIMEPLARITRVAKRPDLEETLRITQWNCERAGIFLLKALDSLEILTLTEPWPFSLRQFYSAHCFALRRHLR